MDDKALHKLKIINKIRGVFITKNTLSELLQYFGIAEEDYLAFGAIWREMGRAGNT